MRSSTLLAMALALAACACTETPPQAIDESDAADAYTVMSEEQFRTMAAQSGLSAEAHRDLAAARRASAPFHRVEAAMAAGWPRDVTGCLTFPDGYMQFGPGTMGLHYLNVAAYLDDGTLEPTTPEALLYEPQADGSLRLTAVEYIIPESRLPRTAPPPVMFGQEMMFHPQFEAWAIHAWLWRHNPYGIFADVNPLVNCEFAAQP